MEEDAKSAIMREIRSISYGNKLEKKPCLKIQKFIPASMSSSTLLFGDDHFKPVRYASRSGKIRNLVVTINGKKGYLHALVKEDYVPGFYLFYDCVRLEDKEYRELFPAARYRIFSVDEYQAFLHQIKELTQPVLLKTNLVSLSPFSHSRVGGNSYYELRIDGTYSSIASFPELIITFACVTYETLRDPKFKGKTSRVAKAYMTTKKISEDGVFVFQG